MHTANAQTHTMQWLLLLLIHGLLVGTVGADCILRLFGKGASIREYDRQSYVGVKLDQTERAAITVGTAGKGLLSYGSFKCSSGVRVPAAAGPALAAYIAQHEDQFPGLVSGSCTSKTAASRCLLTICDTTNVVLSVVMIGIQEAEDATVLCAAGNSSVSMVNVTTVVQDNTAGSILAASDHARLSISNGAAVYRNTASKLGVLSARDSSSITIDNATVSQNQGADQGGAIVLRDAAGLTIRNDSILQSNSAYSRSAKASIYTGQAYGGAIWAGSPGDGQGSSTTITITDSTFKNNYVNTTVGGSGSKYAQVGGGAIFSGRNLSLSNVTFESNIAGRGGAIWLDYWANLVAVAVNFTANEATGDASSGGAIYAPGHSSIELHNGTVFVGNKATGEVTRGGAIYMRHYGQAFMHPSTAFINNSAVGSLSQGGAIYQGDETRVDARGVTMRANSAGFGGAVALSRAQFVARRSSFDRNEAVFAGGVFYLDHGYTPDVLQIPEYERKKQNNLTQIELRSCNISQNSAKVDGGAIAADWAWAAAAGPDHEQYAQQMRVLLTEGTHLLRNRAKDGSGGAVRMRGGHLQLESQGPWHTTLQGNQAGTDGGAIAAYRMPSESARSLISEPGCSNRTGKQEAGLEIVGPVRIVNNTADRAGGGIYVDVGVVCDTKVIVMNAASGRGSSSSSSSSSAARIVQPPLLLQNHASAFGTNFKLPWMCDAGYNITGPLACMKCSAGTFAFTNNCTQCPTGCMCPGGAKLEASPGYWLANASSTQPVLCPTQEACRGGPAVGQQCDADNGFTGFLCGQCKPGYSQPAPFSCHACKSSGTVLQVALFSFVPLFGVYSLWAVAWVSSGPGSSQLDFTIGDVAKQLVWWFQVVVILGRLAWYSWGPAAREGLQALQIAFSVGEFSWIPYLQCLWAGKTGGVPWGFVRAWLALLMPVIFGLAVVLLHCLIVAAVLAAVALSRTLKSSDYCSQRGQVNAAGPQQFTAFAPQRLTIRNSGFFLRNAVVSLCDRFLRYLGLHSSSIKEWREDFQQRLALLPVVVLLWFYPLLLRTSLGFFACKGISKGHSFWIFDLSVECYSGMHAKYAAAMGTILLLLFCIGVPVLFGSCLWRWQYGGKRVQDYLYRAFRQDALAWEGLLHFRTVILVLVSVFSPIMNYYYGLILLGLFLAVCLLLQAAYKPYRDFAAHWLQMCGYVWLLFDVAAGMLVSTNVSHITTLDQDQVLMNLFKSGVSVAFMVWNCMYVLLALLVIWSIASRKWRAQLPSEQLCRQGAAAASGWWVLGLWKGSSKLGLPLTYSGIWHMPPPSAAAASQNQDKSAGPAHVHGPGQGGGKDSGLSSTRGLSGWFRKLGDWWLGWPGQPARNSATGVAPQLVPLSQSAP